MCEGTVKEREGIKHTHARAHTHTHTHTHQVLGGINKLIVISISIKNYSICLDDVSRYTRVYQIAHFWAQRKRRKRCKPSKLLAKPYRLYSQGMARTIYPPERAVTDHTGAVA